MTINQLRVYRYSDATDDGTLINVNPDEGDGFDEYERTVRERNNA